MYSLSTFTRKNDGAYCTAVIDLTQKITPKEAIEITRFTPKDEIHLNEENESEKQKVFTIKVIDEEYYIKLQS